MYKRQAELSLIQELGKAINSSLDLDSVLNYFIDMTSRITCLLYTSDAADDLLCVDLGGRRILKKKKNKQDILFVTISHTYLPQ